MFLIGLTGGAATGKSTSTSYFRELGVPVIDADEVARQIVEPDQPAFKEISQTFGDSVVNPLTGEIVSILLDYVSKNASISSLQFLTSGPLCFDESDFRGRIEKTETQCNHSSSNFPPNGLGGRQACRSGSQLCCSGCTTFIRIVGKIEQVAPQSYCGDL